MVAPEDVGAPLLLRAAARAEATEAATAAWRSSGAGCEGRAPCVYVGRGQHKWLWCKSDESLDQGTTRR